MRFCNYWTDRREIVQKVRASYYMRNGHVGSRFKLAMTGVTVSVVLASCSTSSSASPTNASPVRAPSEFTTNISSIPPETSIPTRSISLGMRPVANDDIFVMGIRQGWFKDVGITITPPPYGNKSTFADAVPLLQNGTLDLEALNPVDMIASLGTVKNVKFIALSDIFQGYQILAAPSTQDKTLPEFIASGMSFKQALRATLMQLKGQTFTIPPGVGDRGFLNTAFSTVGLNMSSLTNVVVTPDSNMLALAAGGSLKYVTNEAAPFAAQFLADGWKPLVTPLDLLKYLPGGVHGAGELLVQTPGVAANSAWLATHPGDALRFTSTMFRIINAEHINPTQQLSYMQNFLNGFAGTNLTISSLEMNINALDPLVGFSSQSEFFDKTTSPFYIRTVFQSEVSFDESKGVLPAGKYSYHSLIAAGEIYHELVALKKGSQNLIAEAASKTLTPKATKLLAAAKVASAEFDYYDAYRLVKAALG